MTQEAPSDHLANSIWPGLWGEDQEGPYLVGGRCKSCGHVTFEARRVCPSCWSSAGADNVPIGRTGTLYTYSIVHQAPAGFAAPVAVGYVDLDDGVRVFAHLEQDAETLQIGRKLALSIDALKQRQDGALQYGPKYRAEPLTP